MKVLLYLSRLRIKVQRATLGDDFQLVGELVEFLEREFLGLVKLEAKMLGEVFMSQLWL